MGYNYDDEATWAEGWYRWAQNPKRQHITAADLAEGDDPDYGDIDRHVNADPWLTSGMNRVNRGAW